MNLISEVEKNYNIEIKNILPLAGGWINEKYILTDKNEKKYVLKELSLEKFPKSYFDTLVFTLDIQDYLYNNGCKVPKVQFNKFNKKISKFKNNKYYFLQKYISGESKFDEQFTYDEIKDVGKNLALLHSKLDDHEGKEYKTSFLKYKTQDALFQEFNEKKSMVTSDTSIEYINEINKSLKIVENIKKTSFLETQKIQLIHGDFTPDNIILFDGKVKAIIDFELVRLNSKLQDIGRIILSLCFLNDKIDKFKLMKFIEGYSMIEPIELNDIIDSIKMVWINEEDIWIKDKYFKIYNPPKVSKFIKEMQWISENWFKLDEIFKGGYSERNENKL